MPWGYVHLHQMRIWPYNLNPELSIQPEWQFVCWVDARGTARTVMSLILHISSPTPAMPHHLCNAVQISAARMRHKSCVLSSGAGTAAVLLPGEPPWLQGQGQILPLFLKNLTGKLSLFLILNFSIPHHGHIILHSSNWAHHTFHQW